MKNYRCLFIDNHHLERTQGLYRRMHQPKKHETPVLIPETPWERGNDNADSRIGAWCAPIRDAKSGQWKMWYWGNAAGAEAKKHIEPMYAESDDGINWRRPNLGQVEFDGDFRNNIMFTHGSAGENILEAIADPNDADYPYKAVTRRRTLLRSRDGITWELLDAQGPPSCDTYRLNYDHLKSRYIMTVKHTQDRPVNGKHVRSRYPVPEYGRSAAVSVSQDLRNWTEPELVFAADETDWRCGADRITGIAAAQGTLKQGPLYVNDPAEYRTEIYSLPVFPYEDMYLALPEIFNVSGVWPHPEKNNALKQNGVLYAELAASRDLCNWTRLGDRAPFIPLSPVGGEMVDQGLITPAGPPVALEDELWFYYTGTRFGHASALARYVREQQAGVMEAEPSSGIFLARLRRDGFISMRADDEPGVLLTRVIEVTGSRLHVNVDAATGELRAEIRDAHTGRAIPGYSLGHRYPRRFNATEGQTCAAEIAVAPDTSMPLIEDTLDSTVHWQTGDDLSGLRGKLVRIQEVFWKCADLTGRKIIFKNASHLLHPVPKFGNCGTSCVAWIKLIPMTGSQVDKWRAAGQPGGKKRVIGHHDFSTMQLRNRAFTTTATTRSQIEPYRNSDFEKLLLEYWHSGEGVPAYRTAIEYAHEIGLQVYLARRMGSMSVEPLRRIRDRDGTELPRLSYAYPESQDQAIEVLEQMASYRPDGIALFFHKGMPFLRYEKLIVRSFMDKTGIDPLTLPEDDPYWMSHRAGFLTGFLRKLRRRLNEYTTRSGMAKLRIAVYVLATRDNNLLLFGLDPETWIREGLTDEVIASYKFCPQPGERVDIYQSRGTGPDFEYLVAAAEGTVCRVYCDLSPAGDTGRYAEPETYRRLAMDMYARGVHAPCIWDAHTRHQLPRQWNMIARLGGKDELAGIDDGGDALHRDIKVEKIGGDTVNRWG